MSDKQSGEGRARFMSGKRLGKKKRDVWVSRERRRFIVASVDVESTND